MSENLDCTNYCLQCEEAAKKIEELQAKLQEIDGNLDFEPDASHTVADMANVGYDLMEALRLCQPDYFYNSSPAEIVSDLTNDICDKDTRIEELQRQNAMLRDWFKKDSSCTCETCWSCAGKGAAVLSETAQSAAWLEAYCAEWMKELEATDEMLTAGAKMFEATLHSAADFKHHASHVFYAMLDAIPTKKD